jgi:RND family efflux transporter MFP subunit
MSGPGTNKSWLFRGAIAMAVLAAGWMALGYLLRQEAPVMAAVRGKSVRHVPGTVEVKAEFGMELKSEVGGRVKSTDLDVGKRVFANDLLVQIDTGDVDLEIERIRNEIVAAKKRVEVGSTLRAELENLRDTFENMERQTKAGAYPAAELEKDRRTLAQTQQRVDLDEVNLRLALQNLENSLRAKEREKAKMTIFAPVDGVVTTVMARAGDLIGSNSPIATIMAVGRVIEAKLSEENFSLVQIGQKASVRFLTHGNNQYNAVISKVLPSADSTTQRYTVFLDVFLPEDRVLVPGLTGEVSIIIAERADAVIVPRRALIGEYLYVVEGSRLTRRKIEKGYESLNQVEIVKGLQPGELVVVEQHDLFRDGDRVRPVILAN